MNEALTIAKTPEGDLHDRWEPLVATSSDNLQNQIDNQRFQAHDTITMAALCTHTGNNVSFQFWRNHGSDWADGSITVDESRSSHC